MPEYIKAVHIKRLLKDQGIDRVSEELAVFLADEMERELIKMGKNLATFTQTVGVRTAQKKHLVAMQKFLQ